VAAAGVYALTMRYSNEEQSPATHYNPDPLARHADITVNGETTRVWFPHTFHRNSFWELTVPVTLEAGRNTVVFASEELPNFDGETYASDVWPGVLLRSAYAPNLDWIEVTPMVETDAPLVSAAVTSRCVAGKSALVVTVTSEADAAIDVRVATPYGDKSVDALAAGRSKSLSFTTRLAAMPAGQVSVSATAGDAQQTTTVAYDGRTCR